MLMGVRMALGLSFLSDRLTATTGRNSLPVNHRCRKTYRHVSKRRVNGDVGILYEAAPRIRPPRVDRKSTRLNSSHLVISYAVFCLKKKKKTKNTTHAHAMSMAMCHT